MIRHGVLVFLSVSSLVLLPPVEAAGERGEALVEEGLALMQATEYEAALERIEQALEWGRERGDLRAEAEAMMAMGHVLAESGAMRRGVKWIEDALGLFEQLELPDDQGQIRIQLARAYTAVAELARAEEELRAAEEIFGRLEDRFGLAKVESQRSRVEVFRGRYEASLERGERALLILAALEGGGEVDRWTLGTRAIVAYSQHQLGRYQEALQGYEELLEKAWQVNDQRQINFAFCNRAEIRWLLGEARPAEEDLRQAIEGWEQARSRIPGTADQRADFLVRQVSAYDRLIRYLADTSRGIEAFEIAERLHARSFLEMLDTPSLGTLAVHDPALWERRRQRLDELGQVRLRLEETSQGGRELRRRLAFLEGEIQGLESQLLAQRSEVTQIAPPTLEEVQNGLEPGEALVAYWSAEEWTFAWVVLDKKARFVRILVPRDELEQEIRSYLEPFGSPRRAEDLALTGREGEHLARGRRLFRWLIGALPPETLAARRLVIVPDGALHYLPFESLVMDCGSEKSESERKRPQESTSSPIHAAYRGCRYLGLEKPLIYSSSAGAFLSLRQRHARRESKERPTLLALAPDFGSTGQNLDLPPGELRRALRDRAPLAHAQEEVRRISGLFAESSVRLDRQATETRLKDEAGHFQLLHFATHGLVSDDLPMSSGLLLGDGGGDDGLLQAHEVLGLELDADLVTLSACRTGRGRLRRGEGVIGLSRSFLAAGASSVIVSLWDVDDRSTPLLMEAFYQEIAAGVAIPEALLAARRKLFAESTEAKLVFRSRPLVYAHPRFWAGFVLIGGPLGASTYR